MEGSQKGYGVAGTICDREPQLPLLSQGCPACTTVLFFKKFILPSFLLKVKLLCSVICQKTNRKMFICIANRLYLNTKEKVQKNIKKSSCVDLLISYYVPNKAASEWHGLP